MSCLRYRPCSAEAEGIAVALNTKATPTSVSRSVAARSGRSISEEKRGAITLSTRGHGGGPRALRRRGMEERLEHLSGDGSRGRAPMARVFHEHRERDARLLRRREADEESMVLAMRI